MIPNLKHYMILSTQDLNQSTDMNPDWTSIIPDLRENKRFKYDRVEKTRLYPRHGRHKVLFCWFPKWAGKRSVGKQGLDQVLARVVASDMC